MRRGGAQGGPEMRRDDLREPGKTLRDRRETLREVRETPRNAQVVGPGRLWGDSRRAISGGQIWRVTSYYALRTSRFSCKNRLVFSASTHLR